MRFQLAYDRGAEVTDNQRIQVDVRFLPEGVKPKLIEMAAEAGVTLTDYIRTLLCERALPRDLVAEFNAGIADAADFLGYVPLT